MRIPSQDIYQTATRSLNTEGRSNKSMPPKLKKRVNNTETYRKWHDTFYLWLHDNPDIPSTRIGGKLAQRIQSKSVWDAVAGALDIKTEIHGEGGWQMIIDGLDKIYDVEDCEEQQRLVDDIIDLPDKAYGSVRSYFMDSANRWRRLERKVRMMVPQELKGHLLFRRSGFGRKEKREILSHTTGSFDVELIEKRMRIMFDGRMTRPFGGIGASTSDNRKSKYQVYTVSGRMKKGKKHESEEEPECSEDSDEDSDSETSGTGEKNGSSDSDDDDSEDD